MIPSTQITSLIRVIPMDPDGSLLIQKLEGTAIVGARMPGDGLYLQQATVEVIKEWIRNGALMN